MIKLTYLTVSDDAKKPEKTTVAIFDGRIMAQYDIPGKANSIVTKMREDGRSGVLYSRGAMIQMFPGKKEEEILEIVKKDIENGVYVAEKKTGKKLEVKDLVIERK